MPNSVNIVVIEDLFRGNELKCWQNLRLCGILLYVLNALSPYNHIISAFAHSETDNLRHGELIFSWLFPVLFLKGELVEKTSITENTPSWVLKSASLFSVIYGEFSYKEIFLLSILSLKSHVPKFIWIISPASKVWGQIESLK